MTMVLDFADYVCGTYVRPNSFVYIYVGHKMDVTIIVHIILVLVCARSEFDGTRARKLDQKRPKHACTRRYCASQR